MRAGVAVLLVMLAGCGGGTFFVGGNFNPGTTTFVSGTVSFVQLTVVNGDVNVTIVSLVQKATTNAVTLCGNQASLFAMNSAVQVTFTPAQPCVSQFTVKN